MNAAALAIVALFLLDSAIPLTLRARRLQATPPPLPLPIDGPIVSNIVLSSDAPTGVVVGQLVLRTSTNYYYGSVRFVGSAPVVVMGQSNSISLYEQRGSVMTQSFVKCTVGTNNFELATSPPTFKSSAFRIIRLDGPSVITLTNYTIPR